MPRGSPRKNVGDIIDQAVDSFVDDTIDRMIDGDPDPQDRDINLNQVSEPLETMYTDLILALTGNPEVYKGSANDAAKIVKLAEQILAEVEKA